RDWRGIKWQPTQPDKKHTWLTEGLQTNFEDFLPIGSKDAKAGEGNAIFANYGRGVATSRDIWAYNFDRNLVTNNIQRMIQAYNSHVYKWAGLAQKPRVRDFIDTDSTKISWS